MLIIWQLELTLTQFPPDDVLTVLADIDYICNLSFGALIVFNLVASTGRTYTLNLLKFYQPLHLTFLYHARNIVRCEYKTN